MNTEKSKANKPHKFFLNLPQKLDLKILDKRVAHQTYLFITLGKI